jgi:uncharacterized protein YgiM (DUF1202 family)
MNKNLARWMLALVLASPLMAAAAEQMSVQVQNAQLRADASFLGKLTASVPYGTRVTILQARGDWRQVQEPAGKTGWLHQSALTKKTISMKAGGQDVATTASGDELALAGKGFNSEIEADFKNKNKDVDFTWIDRMEKYKVTMEEITRFLNEGQVKPPQS